MMKHKGPALSPSDAVFARVLQEARRLPLRPASLLILGDRINARTRARAAAARYQEKMKRLRRQSANEPSVKAARSPRPKADAAVRQRAIRMN
jgi:hypothetical protein